MDASIDVSNESVVSPSRGITSPGGKTALELMKQEESQTGIVTFSAQIDEMLGGGVPLGRITEICGPPGIGKTQLSIQLAVDVTIPEFFGGLGKQAVYIDTEGSFLVDRVYKVASATVEHIKRVAESSGDKEMKQAASQYTVEKVLSSIHHYRCHNYIELIAVVNILPEFVQQQNNQVSLILVDSIACHFRHDIEDMTLRNRLLAGLAQNLIKLASQRQIAMTTRVLRGQKSQLVPALGDSWGHLCTNRIILYWGRDEVRYANLCKSSSRPEANVPYQITADGVRDIEALPRGDKAEEEGAGIQTDPAAVVTRKRPHPQ
ncbi:DNA repair protein RAD51 homolog 3-like isoform X2 [Dysidea avara]|uniref:DNA repair protein RAD51 homolog 3-like isoform X2 n=1 Tax=Dysidea avara TaxID=196820 RepID=UPI0033239B80